MVHLPPTAYCLLPTAYCFDSVEIGGERAIATEHVEVDLNRVCPPGIRRIDLELESLNFGLHNRWIQVPARRLRDHRGVARTQAQGSLFRPDHEVGPVDDTGAGERNAGTVDDAACHGEGSGT